MRPHMERGLSESSDEEEPMCMRGTLPMGATDVLLGANRPSAVDLSELSAKTTGTHEDGEESSAPTLQRRNTLPLDDDKTLTDTVTDQTSEPRPVTEEVRLKSILRSEGEASITSNPLLVNPLRRPSESDLKGRRKLQGVNLERHLRFSSGGTVTSPMSKDTVGTPVVRGFHNRPRFQHNPHIRRFSIGSTDDPAISSVPLSETELGLYNLLFSRLDGKVDGMVHVDEIINVCRLLNMKLTEREVELLSQRVNDGEYFNQDDFISFMSCAKGTIPSGTWDASVNMISTVVKTVFEDSMDLGGKDRRLEYIQNATPGGGRTIDVARRWVWELSQVVTAVYYSLMVPFYFIHMHRQLDGTTGWAQVGIELFLTITSLLEMLWWFRVNLDPFSLKSFSRLLRSKTKPWILILTGIPFDFFVWAAGIHSGPVYAVAFSIRLLNMFKLHGLFKVSSDGLISAKSVKFSFGILPIIRQLLYFFVVVHVITCIFLAVNCTDDSCRSTPSFPEYQTGLYWTLYTLSSVGYGDIDVKTDEAKFLATSCFVFTIIINGWLVGKITSYMVLDTDGEHRQMMHRTLQVITHYHLPEDVIEDILSLQHHVLSKKLNLRSFTDVVEMLPVQVQEALSLYVKVQHMGQIPLFLYASAACKVALAETLRSRIIARDEYIIVEGEIGTTVYFLIHGFAEVLKNNEHIVTLTKGAVFGEMALLSDNSERAASIRSLTLCEVLYIEKREFDSIASKFPALRKQIEMVIAERRGEQPVAEPEKVKKAMLRPRQTLVGSEIKRHLRKKKMVEAGRLQAGDDDPELDGVVNERRISSESRQLSPLLSNRNEENLPRTMSESLLSPHPRDKINPLGAPGIPMSPTILGKAGPETADITLAMVYNKLKQVDERLGYDMERIFHNQKVIARRIKDLETRAPGGRWGFTDSYPTRTPRKDFEDNDAMSPHRTIVKYNSREGFQYHM
eukprot:Sspe_Gene.81085::Locus_51641_Transcript_1_1_Confidence_1.000_Length_3214::g.81085::m.81085/K04910/KCNH7; potassium voltage-gated channel Eag-related subfamily H member 7